MQLPRPGELFQRKYKLQEVLGRGGFAIVVRATDVEVGRDVAIKILAPSAAEGYSPGIASRFMREARVIAGLQDPHTITMFDFGRSDEGLLYMVFEYVRGQDLGVLLEREGALSEPIVVHVLEQVLHSLREAHGAGILHRDIKPANILVYEYMGDPHRVKLLDFGIAKPVAAGGGGINITREGAMVGTPRYMSPEQIFGGELGPPSDLYSLGLVAYEMLTGRPAIRGNTSKETIREQLSDAPVIVPRNAGASAALCQLVEAMVARAPSERLASADAVLRQLEMLEPDATDKMVVPNVILEADARGESRVPTAESEPKTGPEQARAGQPTKQSDAQSEPPMSAVKTAVLGLLIGAALVAVVLVALSSLRETADTPPTASIANSAGVDVGLTTSGFASPSLETSEPTDVVDLGSAEDAVAAVDVGPSNGCGEEPGWEGMEGRRIMFGLQHRSYLVYLPKSYDPDVKHPIVLMFHKTSSSGPSFLRDTNMREVADREKFVVLAMNASDSMEPWRAATDVEYVARAVEEADETLCIDTSRLFAIGHGVGGRMSRDLACEMQLSGVAITGSGQRINEPVCEPDPPVPLLRFQGMKDRYVPAKGGISCLGSEMLSLRTVERQWRERNGCSGRRSPYVRQAEGTCFAWECDAPFVSCRLEGGHDWPMARPEMFEVPGCASRPADFPIGETIWKFFAEHGRTLE